MVLGPAEGLAHDTYFAFDEVLSVPRHLLREEIGLFGPDHEPELLEKLTNAWNPAPHRGLPRPLVSPGRAELGPQATCVETREPTPSLPTRTAPRSPAPATAAHRPQPRPRSG